MRKLALIGPLCGSLREFRARCVPHSGPSRAKRGKGHWRPADRLREDVEARSPLAGQNRFGWSEPRGEGA